MEARIGTFLSGTSGGKRWAIRIRATPVPPVPLGALTSWAERRFRGAGGTSHAAQSHERMSRCVAQSRDEEATMARKYGKKASKKVEKAMHERKRGTLKSGRSGKKVTSRKQAIAIGLSQARKKGAKVPKKR